MCVVQYEGERTVKRHLRSNPGFFLSLVEHAVGFVAETTDGCFGLVTQQRIPIRCVQWLYSER